MKTSLIRTPLEGLLVLEIAHFEDERGFFIETWHEKDFADAGLDARFVQDNHSRSRKNVIRGLHYQDASAPVGKLVRCTAGRIYDVAVDIRRKSPTFGQWFGLELNAENKRQLWVPPGFAHGFATLTEGAEVQYKQTDYYAPAAEGSIRWDDPEIAVEWPVSDPILSPRDRSAMNLAEYRRNPAFL